MDEKEIKRLTDRYFDGLTTESEERRLRRYAATVADPRLDELRAVMGLVETGRAESRRGKRVVTLRRMAVAASVAIAVGCACLYSAYRTDNVCVAYVGGERCTEQTLVMEQMRRSFRSVMPTSNDDSLSPEAQLKSLLNTSEEE